MDAITLLKDDHKAVEKLFKKFEKAGYDRAGSAAADSTERALTSPRSAWPIAVTAWARV
ncbi:hypothetical protein GCM10010468_24580 [Actinocorallia longicatena]|uniref:Uncharacterized protein n=1 Tax=Actinocorallia longicatena TaxID=111803 RepID=A0ABP6Q7Z9_9ACTN